MMDVIDTPSRETAMPPRAIIVSHGQPSDPLPAEADLAALTLRVAAHLPDWQINSATLANPGALDAALAAGEGTPLIYPLFMTDGWFVRSALPKRLGQAEARILAPLGSDPDLPDLVASHLGGVLHERRWQADETSLLVASHGSGRSANSKQATEAFVEALSARIAFKAVHTGYIEQDPRLDEATRRCTGAALCLPFFAAYGGHVKEDITEALAAVDFDGPLLDPIGTLDAIPGLIARGLRQADVAQGIT